MIKIKAEEKIYLFKDKYGDLEMDAQEVYNLLGQCGTLRLIKELMSIII